MSFKKTSAFIRGTWDGAPDASNFTQDATVFATPAEFTAYADADMIALFTEYINSGDVLNFDKDLSSDDKVLISTIEYVDEAAWTAFKNDARWAAENDVTKLYDVELAAAPEDVNTFDEPGRVYYHSSAHLF